MRKAVPILAGMACGIIILADFYLPSAELDALGGVLAEGAMILAAFALLLGILNLLAAHARRIGSGESRRGLSLLLVASLVGTLAAGVLAPTSPVNDWLFERMYAPLQATMTALLAFFAVSAAYRAFRLRSLDALILMATSLFMLLTQLPFGQTLWPELSAIRDWMLAVPVTAGVRGIIVGAALGTMATSLRVLLGVDRPAAQGAMPENR